MVCSEVIHKDTGDIKDILEERFVNQQKTTDLSQSNLRSQPVPLIASTAKSMQFNNEEQVQSQNIRTATGGIIYTILVVLTIIAFVGNAAFMIDVFWLSR
jgi:hypothetical protein